LPQYRRRLYAVRSCNLTPREASTPLLRTMLYGNLNRNRLRPIPAGMAERINVMNGPKAQALSVSGNVSLWPLWASGVRIPLPAPIT